MFTPETEAALRKALAELWITDDDEHMRVAELVIQHVHADQGRINEALKKACLMLTAEDDPEAEALREELLELLPHTSVAELMRLEERIQRHRNLHGSEAFLFIPLICLDISTRARNALKQHDINVLRDLIVLSEDELSSIPGIGLKLVWDIQNYLKKIGLSLNMTVPDPPNKKGPH